MLGRSLPRARAWTVFDSMRVSGAERWALHERGELPDAAPYNRQVPPPRPLIASLTQSAHPCDLDGTCGLCVVY